MPLPPGTWLGQYEILEHIGSGGMGDVYRANDNKLKREVALKVLPQPFARDPDRVTRFRREAQVLAQLNHPNIAAIYNFEEIGETRFLVMELVLGETLRERIRRGALPMEEALEICSQITEGLEHAHEKPIVHRDLKPANVKVTPEGQVKVLDFGLAKAFGGDAAKVDTHDLPTGSLAGTLAGTILGTPAYMSPEQAKGKTVDRRTDIWALGCVLYELLTAKRAFEGEDVPEILAAVLKGEPDWSALPAETPEKIQALLRRCLQKDASRRFHAAADVRIEMEQPSVAPATVEQKARPVRLQWSRGIAWVAVAFFLGALAAGIAVWYLRTPGPQPIKRLAVTLPNNVALATLDLPTVAISPDGSHLAYVGSRGGTTQLFLRALGSLEATPIAGTGGASMPFFSPDGQWLGFFVTSSLKKVSISGGAAVTVSNVAAAVPRGASWGADDAIVLGSNVAPLLRVSAAGGTPQPLTKREVAKGELSHRWPQLLPDGKAVLFTVQTVGAALNFDEAPIAIQQLETGQRKVLVQGGTYPRYLSTGHLTYVRGGTLMAAPFDLKRLELTGPAVPVVEGISEATAQGGAQLSISDQGSLVYIPGSVRGAERTLVLVDRKGVEQPLGAPPRPYVNPRLSPDGHLLAVDTGSDIWIYDIERRTLSRLTFDGASSFPLWSPDGKRIAFRSAREGKPTNLFWKPADGSGPDERLTTSEHLQLPYSWSPDGQVIAFIDTDPMTGVDIWVLPLAGDPRQTGTEGRKSRVFLRTPFYESGARFSPDGRWLAYVSDESGRYEIYVQPYPGPGGKWQISNEGGIEPFWARNGELFYRNGNRLMIVETKTQPTFNAGAPRLLFEGPYELGGTAGVTNYAVSADGQRFVMVKAAGGPEGGAPTQINVVLNWFEELRRRVPAAK